MKENNENLGTNRISGDVWQRYARLWEEYEDDDLVLRHLENTDESLLIEYFVNDEFNETIENLIIPELVESQEIYEIIENMKNMLLLQITTLRPTIVNEDIFYYIYQCSPALMTEEYRRGPYNLQRMDTHHQYWTGTHSRPTDDGGPMNFLAHYRMNRASFYWLVNRLSLTEQYIGSILRGGHAVEVQVACVLWRFANTHFGYRIASTHLGVRAGSYRNFTERFINAIKSIAHEVITWPIADSERALNMAREFHDLGEGDKRLDKIIGAVDGKLVSIHAQLMKGIFILIENKTRRLV